MKQNKAEDAGRLKITVERLGGLGDGVAEHGGKRVVIPGSAPGDELEVRIVTENNKRILAEIVEIITPSREREEHTCSHYEECGGCSLQHISRERYNEFKKDILRHTISRAGFDSEKLLKLTETGPRIRRRITVHCRMRSGIFQAGFYKAGSRELVPVAECPQVEPAIERLIVKLPDLIGGVPLANSISNIQITQTVQGLDLVIHCGKHPQKEDKQKLTSLVTNGDAARISYQYQNKISTIASVEKIQVAFHNIRANFPPGGFLQASVAGQERMIDLVLVAMSHSTRIADLYSGCGTFILPLLKKGHLVTGWEGNSDSVRALRSSIAEIGLQSRGKAEQRDLLSNPVSGAELRGFDGVIINPPRNGAESQVEAIIAAEMAEVVMISCFPRTLERDLALFNKAGYKLVSAEGIDQFYWTPHLENVLVLHAPSML